MGLISLSLPSDGSTADAADIGTPLTTIATEINGQLDNNNIKSGAAIDGSKLADTSIPAAKLATSAITLGLTTITNTDFTTSSATAVQITGFTVTVTIPAGGRRIRVTAYCAGLYNTTNAFTHLTLWDGTVGSGTLLNTSTSTPGTATGAQSAVCMYIGTPAAGSKTYNVGLSVTAGTGGTTVASASNYLLVEAI